MHTDLLSDSTPDLVKWDSNARPRTPKGECRLLEQYPRYSLVVDEDVKKPTQQTNLEQYAVFTQERSLKLTPNRATYEIKSQVFQRLLISMVRHFVIFYLHLFITRHTYISRQGLCWAKYKLRTRIKLVFSVGFHETVIISYRSKHIPTVSVTY